MEDNVTFANDGISLHLRRFIEERLTEQKYQLMNTIMAMYNDMQRQIEELKAEKNSSEYANKSLSVSAMEKMQTSLAACCSNNGHATNYGNDSLNPLRSDMQLQQNQDMWVTSILFQLATQSNDLSARHFDATESEGPPRKRAKKEYTQRKSRKDDEADYRDSGDDDLISDGDEPDVGGSLTNVNTNNSTCDTTKLLSPASKSVSRVGARGRQYRGHLPESAIDILKKWLFEHEAYPYPSEDEKAVLCAETHLTLTQVNNWFTNARRRILKKKKKKDNPSTKTSDE
jgi:hypothetical protein